MKCHQNPPKPIKNYPNPSKSIGNPSKSTQIARTCIKIASASARARAIHFDIYSVCSFHMFDPVIDILDH